MPHEHMFVSMKSQKVPQLDSSKFEGKKNENMEFALLTTSRTSQILTSTFSFYWGLQQISAQDR